MTEVTERQFLSKMDCLLLATGISELGNPSQVYKWIDIMVVIWGVYKLQGSLVRIANWLAKIKIVLMSSQSLTRFHIMLGEE